MLANLNRLRKDFEIQKVFKQGKSEKSENFVLRWRRGKPGANRFAVIVSTKVHKLSTRRNALKRQMREVIRQLNKDLPQGHDVVLRAKKLPNWPIRQKLIAAELADIFNKLSGI